MSAFKEKTGFQALNGLMERSKKQLVNRVEKALFLPHLLIVGQNEFIANHQNYVRWGDAHR